MSIISVRRIAAASVLFALASAVPAQAQIEAGTLSCRGTGGGSFVVGSVRRFSCAFRPSIGGPAQQYEATIRRAGLDIGFTNAERLGWAVFAPSQRIGPGDLAGNYGGVSAGASVGVGATANALAGGLNNSFALQPLSLEAQRGLNVSAGVAGLELQYIPPVVRRHRGHR
jgi:hypothetical protein